MVKYELSYNVVGIPTGSRMAAICISDRRTGSYKARPTKRNYVGMLGNEKWTNLANRMNPVSVGGGLM